MDNKDSRNFIVKNSKERISEIKRVRCPKCGTAVIHQVKEETVKDVFLVTYYCGGCDIDFTKKYAIGNYS